MDPSILLQKHLPSLTQDLDSTRVLDHLFSQKIFNRCEYDKCRGLTSTGQSREITLILMDKGERGYGVFCSWLDRHQPYLKSLLDKSARDEGAGSLVFVNENVFNEKIASKNAVIERLETDLKDWEKIIQTLKASQVQELEKVASVYEEKRRQLERELADLTVSLNTESEQLSQRKEENDKLKHEILKHCEEKSKLEEYLTEQKELYEAVTNLTDCDTFKDPLVEEDDCSGGELPCCIMSTSACDRKFLLLLPCLHALCSPCLDQCDGELITCPCGEEVIVKDIKQIDHVRRKEEKNSADINICGFFCKQTTQAENRCLNCDVTMCRSCLASHNKIGAFDGHCVVAISNEGIRINTSGKKLTDFQKDNVFGFQNEGCRESSVSEMVKIHKEKLDNIQIRILQTKAQIERVNETERKTLVSMNSMQRDLLLKVQRHFKQMATKVQCSTEENRRTLQENMAKLKQTLSKFRHTIDYAERAVLMTNEVEFRELGSMIQSKFSEDWRIRSRISVKFIQNEEKIPELLELDMSFLYEVITLIGTGELRGKYQSKPEMEEREDSERKVICLEPETINTANAMIAELGESGNVRIIMKLDSEQAILDTLLCPKAEFSRENANSQVVRVLNDGKLQNRPDLKRNSKMLQRYEGTTIISHQLSKGVMKYHEIHATVELASKLPVGFQILEVAFCKDSEQDLGRMLGGRDGAVSLQVVHCMVHRSICRLVRKGKDVVRCADDTFANIATALAELKYGILLNEVQGRLAFIDITKKDVIAVLDNISFEDDFRWMCGVYSPEYTRVTVELASWENIQMTQEKLMLIVKAMSMTSSC